MRQQTLGWSLVLLVVLQMTLPALALPQLLNRMAEQGSNLDGSFFSKNSFSNTFFYYTGRKFAVKPNANKKVITETNEITVKLLL